jgi:hypothetical protein
MKKIYKNLLCITVNTSLCLLFVFTAGAQNSTVSKPTSSPAPAQQVSRPSGGVVSNGGGGGARPSNNNAGVSRPSGPPQRTVTNQPGGNQPQRPGFQPQPGNNNINRQGVAVRGNYGYAPRSGAQVATTPQVRGNYGYAPRSGNTRISTGTNYRTIPTIGYGGSGYWGNHGYNYHNHGYYKTYYLPRLGFSLGVLPYGYYPFYFGDYQYFYSDGLFYQYDNSQYTVVEPPIGAQVTALPDKAQSIVINGQQYYELNGVYYLPVTKDDGTVVYEIAGKDGELNTGSTVQDQPQAPRIGDIVTQLPQDCRKINVNGQKMYVSPDGVYYQEQVDSNNNKTYKIVGLPSDENGQN